MLSKASLILKYFYFIIYLKVENASVVPISTERKKSEE